MLRLWEFELFILRHKYEIQKEIYNLYWNKNFNVNSRILRLKKNPASIHENSLDTMTKPTANEDLYAQHVVSIIPHSKEQGFLERMAISRPGAWDVKEEPKTACPNRKQRNCQRITSKGFKNL